MSSVVSFGTNVAAQRKRVMYFGTSVIYEGMPVCYDNSTTNVLGFDPYSSTASTTTTEGYQNEGKFLRVENPNADNVSLFAGTVAHGPKVGTTGVTTGVWLDIFIPNGAVVPVRTDLNCIADQTILAINTGEQELGVPLRADSRSVAIARETYDRSTAGLVLAQLCPDRFISQDFGGTALSIDDADSTADVVVNRINVKSLQTGGQFTALLIKAESAAGASSPNVRGQALKAVAIVSATVTNHVYGTTLEMEVTGGTPINYLFPLQVKLYESGATLSSVANIGVLELCHQVAQAPAATTFSWISLSEDGAEHADQLIRIKHLVDFPAVSVTGTITLTSGDALIKVYVSGDAKKVWYIPLVYNRVTG